MELRLLQYFLAVAKNENITKAAEELHVTQPTLSRQLTDLEEELGAQLFVRGKRRTQLTEAGLFLKTRAEEILALTDKTLVDFQNADSLIAGDVYIGCGETEAMRDVADVMASLQVAYPKIRIHTVSEDEDMVLDQLEKGLLDFGVLCRSTPPLNYVYRQLPYVDQWGLLMHKDNPLAQKQVITREDVEREPLLVSRQALAGSEFDHWLGKSLKELNIVATFNLVFNAFFYIENNMGSLICFDKLAHEGNDKLVFRPLEPNLTSNNYLIWRKDQVFSRAARLLKDAFDVKFK